jgi:hypothetical protein
MVVTSLNDNDVLLGRGCGAKNSEGNDRFQSLILTRKEEYMSLESYKEKRAIADSLYDEITRRGGRFLALVDTGEKIQWEEVSRKAGLEKGECAYSRY